MRELFCTKSEIILELTKLHDGFTFFSESFGAGDEFATAADWAKYHHGCFDNEVTFFRFDTETKTIEDVTEEMAVAYFQMMEDGTPPSKWYDWAKETAAGEAALERWQRNEAAHDPDPNREHRTY